MTDRDLYTDDNALELHRTIHDFAALSRFITESRTGDKLLGLKMDSQSRVFEAPVETVIAGTPLRCPRSMTAQALVPWTPARLLVALFTTLISVPAQLAPALNRRRA
jgi:hypothetical protein